jgi:Lytic transglycolase/Putative peptidoglycan binding domain
VDEGLPPRGVETEYRRRQRSAIIKRPDRIALWAVGMAIVAMIAAATSAHAGSGGTTASGGGTGGSSGCPDEQFGSRALSLGDCGDDVKTLHWLLKADAYGVSLNKEFDSPTDNSVRSFQRHYDLNTSGVVRQPTRRALIKSMPKSGATWYQMLHHQTACGVTLHRNTIGVAHRNLPCGTRVTLAYHHRFVRARVIDRGPYTAGVRWDLTKRTADKLRLTGTGRDEIRAAPIK